MKDYFRLIRVSQWVKNLFVFLPVVFSGNLFNETYLVFSILIFVTFSFISSSVYVLNDYMDIESDRNHPQKKNRPLASGKITKREAVTLFLTLITLSILFLYLFANLATSVTILIYLLINVAYSFGAKHIAIIDVSIISFGFLLRVFAGGFMTGITISNWTILLTFTIAMVMAFGKRRGELVNVQGKNKTRKALDGYNLEFLNSALVISCVMTIVCYVMYTMAPETQSKMHHYVFYTFIFVIVGVLRYLQQTFVFNKTESPTKMVFKDLFLQITIFLWGISMLLVIYLK